MISISNGLKTRASQRHRNNCLTVEMEKGVPTNYCANCKAPTLLFGRGGGCRAISLPQIKLLYHSVIHLKNEGGVPNCWPNKIETVSAPFR